MNTTIAMALLRDAFYQVMDNWVFRLLIVAVICLVAPTFLISMRETEMVVLFGFFDWSVIKYDSFFGAFNMRTEGIEELNVLAIQAIQSLLIEGLAGSLGILISIAATAFFVPRMLEKGAADTLFSKPLARATLLLSRYLTGVLFVAILAGVLIGGMHVGFLICSGYSDPGFLWGAVTLIYLFSIVHAFSVCVATLTRSSVAAILLSAFFWMGTGCVHGIWIQKEYAGEQGRFEVLRQEAQAGEDEVEIDEEESNRLVRVLVVTLDTLHFTLPKTTDSAFLTKMFRRSVEGAPYAMHDADGSLTIEEIEGGLEPISPGDVDLAAAPVVWTRRGPSGDEEVRLELSRRGRSQDEGRKLTPPGSAKQLVATLEADPAVVEGPDRNRDTTQWVDDLYAVQVDWTETRGGETHHRQTCFFALGDWLFSLEATFDESLDQEARREIVREHVGQYEFAAYGSEGLAVDDWYERRFSVTAPLRYNVFFSIGSTLAFCFLVLFIAWIRLLRIDF